jgi:hypothetical protein
MKVIKEEQDYFGKKCDVEYVIQYQAFRLSQDGLLKLPEERGFYGGECQIVEDTVEEVLEEVARKQLDDILILPIVKRNQSYE